MTHKGTFESALWEEVAKDPRILGRSFHMSWGKGLDEILRNVDATIFELTYVAETSPRKGLTSSWRGLHRIHLAQQAEVGEGLR